jgi:hypothetical protein
MITITIMITIMIMIIIIIMVIVHVQCSPATFNIISILSRQSILLVE